MQTSSQLSRRALLSGTAASLALPLLPRRSRAQSPAVSEAAWRELGRCIPSGVLRPNDPRFVRLTQPENLRYYNPPAKPGARPTPTRRSPWCDRATRRRSPAQSSGRARTICRWCRARAGTVMRAAAPSPASSSVRAPCKASKSKVSDRGRRRRAVRTPAGQPAADRTLHDHAWPLRRRRAQRLSDGRRPGPGQSPCRHGLRSGGESGDRPCRRAGRPSVGERSTSICSGRCAAAAAAISASRQNGG